MSKIEEIKRQFPQYRLVILAMEAQGKAADEIEDHIFCLCEQD